MSVIDRVYFALRSKKRLRREIRGYRYLVATVGLDFYRDLRNQLASIRFLDIDRKGSWLLAREQDIPIEISIRQIVNETLGYSFLANVLIWFATKRAIVYPMPKVWQTALLEEGLGVNRVACSILWGLAAFTALLKNTARDIRFFWRLFFSQPQKKYRSGKPYLMFLWLSGDNIPRELPDGTLTRDVCGWVLGQVYSNEQGLIIGHDIEIPDYSIRGRRVSHYPRPWYFIWRISDKFALLLWWLGAFFTCVLALSVGRWWDALLLSEALRAKAVLRSPSKALPRAYLYPFSNTFRPLWTYAAEKKGAPVYAYFCSMWNQPTLGSRAESLSWKTGLMSWSNVLIWTESQRDQLLKDSLVTDSLRPINLLISGPGSCYDSGEALPEVPPGTVAVFPVEPHRESVYLSPLTTGEWRYSNPDIYERFLFDTQLVLSDLGLTLAVKAKREIGRRRLSKKILRCQQDIFGRQNVIAIPPGISASRLCEACVGSISLPFTSAAWFSGPAQFGSIFYDPTGLIRENDRAAGGIPVKRGIGELRDWANGLASALE